MQNRYRRQSDRPGEGGTGKDGKAGDTNASYVRRPAYIRESLSVQASHANSVRPSWRCSTDCTGSSTCKSAGHMRHTTGNGTRYMLAMFYAVITNIAIGVAVCYLLSLFIQGAGQ